MSTERSTTLYKTPFSASYWRDAASELKSTKMLVITALMVALRVVLKGIYIPLGPTLKINIAFVINALGAMIFGPVMAAMAACVSDFLGVVLIDGSTYFLPFMLVEVAGSVIFALFLYRARITPTRIILSRFCIDMLVNIGMNIPISVLYYRMILGKDMTTLVMLQSVVKNVCLFSIESWILTLFLTVLVPITYRAKLTFDGNANKATLKFTKKQLVLLVILLIVGIVGAAGYGIFNYNTTSLSGGYTPEERYNINCQMTAVVQDHSDEWDEETLVTTVESAYPKFGEDDITYTVALYVVDEAALEGYEQDLETIRGLSKSKAAAVAGDGVMERVETLTIVINHMTGGVTGFQTAE